jgi:hypothetical protein
MDGKEEEKEESKLLLLLFLLQVAVCLPLSLAVDGEAASYQMGDALFVRVVSEVGGFDD